MADVSITDLHETINGFMEAWKTMQEAAELNEQDALTPDEWEDLNTDFQKAMTTLHDFLDKHQHQLGIVNGGYPVIILYPDDVWQELDGLPHKRAYKLMERLTSTQFEEWAEVLRTDEDIHEFYTARLTELVQKWLENQK